MSNTLDHFIEPRLAEYATFRFVTDYDRNPIEFWINDIAVPMPERLEIHKQTMEPILHDTHKGFIIPDKAFVLIKYRVSLNEPIVTMTRKQSL